MVSLLLYASFRRSLDSLVALLWTPTSLVEMYKHSVVYVLETAMNNTEHGVHLLDFVCQVFGKLEVVMESNTQIFF